MVLLTMNKKRWVWNFICNSNGFWIYHEYKTDSDMMLYKQNKLLKMEAEQKTLKLQS